MDARDYVFPQHAADASRAFGRLLDRITDRILPTPSPKAASPWTKYGVTFLGSLVWSVYGASWTFGRYFPETDSWSEGSRVFDIPDVWIYLIWSSYAILSVLSVIIVVLVGRSFDRGRPLAFFFWGLIFPTAALSILRLAFPELPIEAETVQPQSC